MTLAELAEQMKCPEIYLGYLKSILDGTEVYASAEDIQEAIALEEPLRMAEQGNQD